jgi:hypothetical protein
VVKSAMEKRGWFADQDDENGGMWRPYFQTDGVCAGIELWFDTEAECDQFIDEELVGAERFERNQ